MDTVTWADDLRDLERLHDLNHKTVSDWCQKVINAQDMKAVERGLDLPLVGAINCAAFTMFSDLCEKDAVETIEDQVEFGWAKLLITLGARLVMDTLDDRLILKE